MLLARRNNNSDWLSNIFDDVFFDTDATPRMNATAPATNIKETDKDYIMEVAAPGLKKEWVRVNIDNDGNLNIAISIAIKISCFFIDLILFIPFML